MQPDNHTPLEVKVWGNLACFTRPENKVERVSYPVMTPSAAKGVLEAIFWKPEFRWRIEEIRVLRPIQYFSILRNEINSRQTMVAAEGWRMNGGGFNASDDRAQRHTLALRDVAYVVRAQVEIREDINEDPAKFRDQFRRRAKAGRCFATPYLGCREFSAWFSPANGNETPLQINEDLGSMLLSMTYDTGGSGRVGPRFFNARLERGVLKVPRAPEGED